MTMTLYTNSPKQNKCLPLSFNVVYNQLEMGRLVTGVNKSKTVIKF